MTTTNSSSTSSIPPSSPGKRKNGSMSQCPYAVALSEDEASQNQSPTSSNDSKKSRTSILTAELSQCPAFNNAAGKEQQTRCPFQDAKSPEEVQKTLAKIPKSHYDADHESSFFQVIKHFHQVHEQGADDGFFDKKILPTVTQEGKCPMQPYVHNNETTTASSSTKAAASTSNPSFAQAMEDCSLAAIMARLAEDMERQEGNDIEEEDKWPRNSNTTVTSKETTTKDTTTATNSQKQTNEDDSQTKSMSTQKRNSLAEALKKGTTVAHQAAEDVHFVRNFIRGEIDRNLYSELILGLYHVYVSLEGALDKYAPEYFASCHFPDALARVPSLQDDVEFWHNTRSPSSRTISPATQDYIDRIDYLSNHNPLLLLAHSYTRYLGDLSGGKVLARVARRALDLDKDTGEGLAFYRFEKVASYKKFKDEYRQALDALPLSSRQIDELVSEANVAFCLNMRLFQELDVMATIPGAHVMPMAEVMAYAHKHKDDEIKEQYSISFNTNSRAKATAPAASGEDQCPFLFKKKTEQDTNQSNAATTMSPAATTTTAKHAGGRCPWPFIFAHDPWQGLKDWQTWLVLALIIAWFRH